MYEYPSHNYIRGQREVTEDIDLDLSLRDLKEFATKFNYDRSCSCMFRSYKLNYLISKTNLISYRNTYILTSSR